MYDGLGDDGRRLHTVQQIADEFGVTRPTIYRRYSRELVAVQLGPFDLDGYTAAGDGSTTAVIIERGHRIVWAQLRTKTPPREPTAVIVAVVKQAVRAFDVPMTAKP